MGNRSDFLGAKLPSKTVKKLSWIKGLLRSDTPDENPPEKAVCPDL